MGESVVRKSSHLQSVSSGVVFLDEDSHENEGDSKKYKLRLKFDGASLLEVVRLNGGHFQNLTHLDISGNSAEKLDLRNLSRLEWLCCSHNQLEILVLSGTSLIYLDCSHNKLESIVVDPLPNNLATLQLSFNNLEELPSWTWMVPDLLLTYASHNRLHSLDCSLPNCLSHLPIRELHLHSNKIEFISKDFIQRASKLKILNLSQNLLENLPSFGKRCPIQELYLSRNQLQDTEDKEALEFLFDSPTIRRLHLAFNKIEKVNERFTTIWKNLEELVLCGNKIRTLPSKMSILSNLRVLRVHSNRLETVPNLTKMPLLRLVDLSHNNLKKINLENLIAGGNLTYLDISCNDRLVLNPEKLSCPKRSMNLVEVTNPRKSRVITDPTNNHNSRDFPVNPPWELGFSELPDRKQTLTVTQYRDVNLANGREALFGIFDGGSKTVVPKSITKFIAKLYAEERNIEESLKLSLKYTLLNSLRNLRHHNNGELTQGILCLLSMQEDNLLQDKPLFTLHLAMVGEIRCLLIESGKKVTRLTDSRSEFGSSQIPLSDELDDNDILSTRCNSEGDLSLSVVKSNRKQTIADTNHGNSNIDVALPDPKVLTVSLTPATEFLLIANQSLWNYVSQEEIVEELELHRHKKSVLIAKRVTDLAQSHSCKQSLSVILVRFKWKSSSSRGLILESKKLASVSENGPLSFVSGFSTDEYSDELSNPLASVATPDSAIDTDRSSGVGSLGTEFESKESSRRSHRATTVDAEDAQSLANTTMSVEQFRCWEYMLEQNTRLLFKKELDSISKGIFQRNGKQRKSVHFPYTSPNASSEDKSGKETTNQAKSKRPLGKSNSSNPGFYSLSKAKSLSHLLEGDDSCKNDTKPSGSRRNQPKPQFPLFTNANAGFLESVRSTKPPTRGTILGGPNAAYFGSSQRLGPTNTTTTHQPHHGVGNRKVPLSFSGYFGGSSDEIQEIKCFEPANERETTRLRKYWDNKITEL